MAGIAPGSLLRRPCPVCRASADRSEEFLGESIDASGLSDFSYSSRKLPEYMNYAMVRCRDCDVVYVDRPPSAEDLARSYHVAQYDSAGEATDAANSYIAAIHPFVSRLKQRQGALEIGTGTGALLELLARVEGFETVIGVEPSAAAIAAAPDDRRAWIKEGVFLESDFASESFDLVCCFMTMEHVREPRSLAEAVRRLLRKDGAFITVAHDYRAPINRFLGKRSPIIDIEHMQLFSKASIARLLSESGFRDVQVRAFANRYALSYWLRLAPLPKRAKDFVAGFIRSLRIDGAKVGLNVGNLMAGGFK